MAISAIGSLGAFTAVATILVLTPGVGTAFLTSTVISHGKRPGYLTAVGMVCGSAIHALAAAVGMAVLLRTFPNALRWIAIGGGIFIIWIGLRATVRALRPAPVALGEIAVPPGRHTFVTTGVIIALGNAPLPLFYLVVVPQYVPRGMQPLTGALLLSLIHLAIAGMWMATLVTLLGRIADVLRRPRVLLTMQLLTAIALIALGAKSIAGVS